MNIFNKRTFSIFAISTIFIFTACTKKRDEYMQTAKEYGIAEIVFNDITNQVDKAIKLAFSQSKSIYETCPTVSITPSASNDTFPKTLKIDFGSGCSGSNGVIRTGIITAVISGKYEKIGTIVNVSLDNFTRDGSIVSGTQTIKNSSKNYLHHTIYDIVVKDGLVSTDDGDIKWSSIQKREWTHGESTPWPELIDDVFRTTGTSIGYNTDGKRFKANVLTPLVTNYTCRYITEGSTFISVDNYPGKTLNYGSGSCDGKAELSYKNKFFGIDLY